ncbi:uncharacterized protein LOC117793946 [Drosophila innubila]|uniref:uncharacterized protein LOC117793946 n=1 Tax=Drosophila innubila TaxID=198719 RepID=UPI00148DB3C1|nr:uncharacterized protein LOC117793946 [Drosophila innubila]XP_034490299.1 uncharacterized protein LOC117793946 [Drosophila innubila]
MARTAFDVQRDFALSSGLRSEIIWDSLSPEQSDVLKLKIANIICESNVKNPNLLAKQRQQLFDNVWKQRIYTNRTLLSTIVYVLVSSERDSQLALQSTSFSCHPVIRTRKCLRGEGEGEGENSEGCCMIFIDEEGRVYGNWQQYVRNNALPKGTMIAPKQGVYTFSGDEVQLTVQATPSTWIKQKILSAGDSIATVGGLVATVPVAATLALPVAAPILIAATVVGVSTAAYSTLRSATRLIDRRWHSQSTSLRDREARSSWLGVAGGVVGLGATGATTAISVLGSKTSLATQLAVKGINVSSIVVSGTGVINGVYDLYLKISDDQSLTSFDMLQIASSLLIFTHSVNNLRIAAKVTNGSSLRRALRHQTRKVLNRISQESSKLHSGDSAATGAKKFKFDIVRTLNDIPIKETLLSLHKIHSHLAQGATFLGAVGAAGLLPSFIIPGAGGEMRLNVSELSTQFGLKFVQQIGNLASFMDVLDGMTRYLSDQATQLLLQLTRTFVEQNVDGIDRKLNTFVSTELVLYRILMHCITNYEHCTIDFLEQRRQDILDIVSKYFESLQPAPIKLKNCRKLKCSTCKGVYYISTL